MEMLSDAEMIEFVKGLRERSENPDSREALDRFLLVLFGEDARPSWDVPQRQETHSEESTHE
jgi:hypothetical protein